MILNQPFRVINSFGERPQDVQTYEKSVNLCNNELYRVETINHRHSLGINGAWSPIELDRLYRNRDLRLLRFYDEVLSRCENADIFIISHENVYHPEFIRKLSKNIYTVLYTGDDPESSYYCSQPYVWAFDHVLCYSVYYDETTYMTDKLIQWGAKRAHHKPHGFHHDRHDIRLSENELFSIKRNIDIIYVGGAYNKVSDLLKVKRAFGNRFKIYGNWGGVGPTLGLYRRHGFFEPVRPLPVNDLVSTYQHAAIGLNMHMSYGPSNLRMWELPINGVMQITDNPIGTSKLFDLGKEIICYDNRKIDKAIDLIDYYLTNDVERMEIARQGYNKVKYQYSFQQTFWDIMPKLQQGMLEKRGGF